jgi:hypothetical protein
MPKEILERVRAGEIGYIEVGNMDPEDSRPVTTLDGRINIYPDMLEPDTLYVFDFFGEKRGVMIDKSEKLLNIYNLDG